jgi:hypothetical protein
MGIGINSCGFVFGRITLEHLSSHLYEAAINQAKVRTKKAERRQRAHANSRNAVTLAKHAIVIKLGTQSNDR